jgi:serine/threonine protein kinase
MQNVALLPGAFLLGKYRVEREIGSGGMGIVLEATHLTLDQRVAIKLLNDRFASSPEITARFLREARIAARLHSDHVARVSDFGQTETGAPYIVMELLVGHDLEAELSQRGKLPVSEAVDVILQACEGVAEAHAVGLVHRDLKPANLFLARRPSRPPIIKVLDFGLSKEAQGGHQKSLTGDDTVFGTPQYMSPEQIQSSKNVDARSDQHALGMILFELLTGEPPYVAQSVTQLVVVIATHPPPSARGARPDVPRGLDQAIIRALAKRPGDRFPDLGGFAEAIAPFGGPQARERAEAIKTSLTARDSMEPGPPRRSSSPNGQNGQNAQSDELVTAPFAGPGAGGRLTPAHTQTGLSSTVDFLRKSRRGQRAAVLGALAVGLGAVIVGAAVLRGGSTSDTAPSAGAEVASIEAVSAPISSAALLVSAGGNAVAVAPSASASPSSSSASGASGAPAGKKPKPTTTSKTVRPPQPKPTASSVIGVFGERTKK